MIENWRQQCAGFRFRFLLNKTPNPPNCGKNHVLDILKKNVQRSSLSTEDVQPPVGLLDVLLIQRVQCLDGVVVLRQGLSRWLGKDAFLRYDMRPLKGPRPRASERLATCWFYLEDSQEHQIFGSPFSNFSISTSSGMGKNLKGRVAFVQLNGKVPIIGRFIIADHQKILDRLSQQSHY